MTLIRFALHFIREYEHGMLNRCCISPPTSNQSCKSLDVDDGKFSDGPTIKDEYKSKRAVHVAYQLSSGIAPEKQFGSLKVRITLLLHQTARSQFVDQDGSSFAVDLDHTYYLLCISDPGL